MRSRYRRSLEINERWETQALGMTLGRDETAAFAELLEHHPARTNPRDPTTERLACRSRWKQKPLGAADLRYSSRRIGVASTASAERR